VIDRLKRFANLDRAEFKPVDLHDMLDAALGLVAHRLEDRITIDRRYDDIPSILGYPKPLSEMFLAILRNAIRAIEGQGSIRIETSRNNDRVSIVISDTGVGIPPEKQQRVFDFAFTTTRNRVGVQTGLSSSYHTVKLHGGDIRVDSTPGQGTSVTIDLPIRPPSKAQLPPRD